MHAVLRVRGAKKSMSTVAQDICVELTEHRGTTPVLTRWAYPFAALIVFPQALAYLAYLATLPTLSKLGFLTIYLLIATRGPAKYQATFIACATLHTFATLLGVTQYNAAFPYVYAATVFCLTYSLILSFRGQSIGKLALLPFLAAYPFAIGIETLASTSVLVTFPIAVIFAATALAAITDLVRALGKNHRRVSAIARDCIRSSWRATNLLLLLIFFFLMWLHVGASGEALSAGQETARSVLSDSFEFLSEGTRDKVSSYFALGRFRWLVLYAVVSVFWYQAADHHSRLWHGCSYLDVVTGTLRRKQDPFSTTQLGFVAWVVGFLVYFFLLFLSLPTDVQRLVGTQVTVKSTTSIAALSVLTGLLATRFITKKRLQSLKFRLLRRYASRSRASRAWRFAILSGPAVVFAPIFAWQTLVPTSLLLLCCYCLL